MPDIVNPTHLVFWGYVRVESADASKRQQRNADHQILIIIVGNGELRAGLYPESVDVEDINFVMHKGGAVPGSFVLAGVRASELCGSRIAKEERTSLPTHHRCRSGPSGGGADSTDHIFGISNRE
ncbi:MAG: hypothetical protein V2G51_06450 [bacterium JZ-2024 1]